MTSCESGPRVSELMTARAEVDRCGKALASAAAAVLVEPETENFAAMHSALQSYTEARKALDV